MLSGSWRALGRSNEQRADIKRITSVVVTIVINGRLFVVFFLKTLFFVKFQRRIMPQRASSGARPSPR
jgi:hypothetical protein